MQEATLLGGNKFKSNTRFDPSRKGPSVVLSNGNLRVTAINGDGVLGNVGHSTGKWYYEVLLEQGENGTLPLVGIGTIYSRTTWPWRDGLEEVLVYHTGAGSTPVLLYGAGQPRPVYGAAVLAGDNIGVALDLDNNKLTFYNNGVAQPVLNLRTYTPGITFYPMVCSGSGGGANSTIASGLFGKALKYPIPVGFSAW